MNSLRIFVTLIHKLNANGGREAAEKVRMKTEWIKFRECENRV